MSEASAAAGGGGGAARVEPIAAVPSNATQVPLRLGFGEEQRSYAASYRSAQQALEDELPRTFGTADRIKTPTLFLGGERDFNVPVQGGQQMYQALRSLGIDTQMVIYPNENHGIQRPSYQRDRLERYLAWYDKYLKKQPAPATLTAAEPQAHK